MPKYDVTVTEAAVYTLTVSAPNETEAMKRGLRIVRDKDALGDDVTMPEERIPDADRAYYGATAWPKDRRVATDRSLPDLSDYGVSDREVREHLATCDLCRRSYEQAAKDRTKPLPLHRLGLQLSDHAADERDRLR